MYDRITIFEDHLVRDINAGRFSSKTNLVLITHGLALRIFLMRWLHWTVDQFLEVYNPPNAEVRGAAGDSVEAGASAGAGAGLLCLVAQCSCLVQFLVIQEPALCGRY